MILALAAIALTQCGPTGPIYSCASTMSTLGPMFSFAPSFTASCACNGADAPGLVFDGGGAYCTKGNEWVGIQTNDMVWCPAGQPRVMPGGDGTGSRGVQVWQDQTNTVTRAQAFDHADWTKGSFSVAAPVVQADACLAPDGTMTGEIVTWPAVTVAGAPDYGFITQATCPLDYDVRTVYARACLLDGGCSWGNGDIVADGGIIIGDGTGAYAEAVNCAFTSSGWTRCRQFDTDGGQRGNVYYLTVDGLMGNTPIQKMCLWQADCQSNAGTTKQSLNPWPPPIRTVAAAVVKGGDVAWYEPALMPQLTSYSLSANLLTESGYTSNGGPSTILEATTSAGAGGSKVLRSDTRAMCSQGSDAFAVVAYSTSTLSADENTYSCSYNGAPVMTESPYVIACANSGGCGDGGPLDSGVAIATRFAIGSRWNTFDYVFWANGVVKSVSVTEPARKDIYLFGDSIVEGNNAGDGFQPQYVIHRVRGATVAPMNEGVSTYDSNQCHTVCVNRLNVIKDAGVQARSYVMWQCGHNGIDDAGCVDCGAGVGVLGDATDCLKRSQDAGIHTLASTVTPSNSLHASIATVNSALTSWCTSNGVLLANTFSALEDPNSPGDLLLSLEVGDHTHLNDAGTYVETMTWIGKGGW